ncbi:hypothetical protein [Methylobacterium sp. A54F]
MIVSRAVAQPIRRSTLDAVSFLLRDDSVSAIDVAAAYVTVGGVHDLLSTMREILKVDWPNIRKRWVVSFDYCRSEPLALKMLASVPKSSVRVHDAVRVLDRACMPSTPFHPKTVLVQSATRSAVLAGSGNISRSGLSKGYEAGILLKMDAPVLSADHAVGEAIAELQGWFGEIWTDASVLDATLLGRYTREFESKPRLAHPTPTDDDLAPVGGFGRLGFSRTDLCKLRTCRHMWIEAGNITKNLGRRRSGNQLMMKRLSRVFFGVPAGDVPQNSPLTKIAINYGGRVKDDCSLTFSDNGMDKLTLPIPDAGGPPTYDQQNLLFKRIGAGSFELFLGTERDKSSWIERSMAIHASYTMPPDGRQFGVF